MAQKQKIYEGKAKILYKGPNSTRLIQYFKDDATAFNASKKSLIEGKGILNNLLSEYVMKGLHSHGIPNHFVKRLNMREQLIWRCEIIPLEVVVRNRAAGSMVKRLGVEEGSVLPKPIVEFYLKNDDLGDPIVTENHIINLNWMSEKELKEVLILARRVNDFLSGLMYSVNINLVDFKIEFGRFFENKKCRLMIADEISPDSCRLWDISTGERLDKDIFRHDLGNLLDGYKEIAKRFNVIPRTSDFENFVI